MKICLPTNRKSYSGQALVMAMIVVIISVIVGLAVFSRTIRDQRLVAFEQASSEALEIADSYINLFASINTTTLFQSVEQGDVEVQGYKDLKNLLASYEMDDLDNDVFASCKEGTSSIKVKLSLTSQEYLELTDSTTMGYIVGPNYSSVADGCKLQLYTEPRGYSSVGFLVHKVYGKKISDLIEYKEYALEDILPYCISSTTECTNSRLQDKASWTLQSTLEPLEIGLKDVKGGYSLDEIRITPIAGTVAVKSVLNNEGCAGELDLKTVKVSVTVTCANASRGKDVLIPRENNQSYSTIFDYTVYNGSGLLQPY